MHFLYALRSSLPKESKKLQQVCQLYRRAENEEGLFWQEGEQIIPINWKFVDLKQNTVPYIAVMHFDPCLAANFLRKEQYRMKLVLAEKPSVAMSLSKVIRANQRGDGYMEGNGYLVSWCVVHLV